MATHKTIVVSFYGAVVKDDNTPVGGFKKFVSDCKKHGHKIRLHTEQSSDFFLNFCYENNLLIYEGDESYDYIISPLAVGTPLDEEGNVDWAVIETILEGVIFPKTNKSEEIGQHMAGIAPHKGYDRVKFNVDEGGE